MNMGVPEIEQFLAHLAIQENVAASTQNQVLSALLFLYKQVLKVEFESVIDPLWAKKTGNIPVVLTREEVWQVLEEMSGRYQLMASILYGTGMRLME